MGRLSSLIETKRVPLSQALVDLGMAEADLNGIVANLAARNDHFGLGDPEDILRKAVDRVFDARDRIDEMRFAATRIERVHAGPVSYNDRDDVLDGLRLMLERIRTGVFDDEGTVDQSLVRVARPRHSEAA